MTPTFTLKEDMADRDELDAARRAAVKATKPNGGLPDGLARWRRDHPHRSSSWRVDKTGGWVFMYADTAYYFGPCRDCDTGRVTTQRQQTKNVTGLGRWPELCDDCRSAKAEETAAKTRRRMQQLRNPNGIDLRQFNNHPDPSLRN
jgi:hypothetical protein